MAPVGQGYKKTNSVKNLDHIELTPWVNIPLKTPLMLLSSFFGAAAAKAITHPDSVPLSELLYATPQVALPRMADARMQKAAGAACRRRGMVHHRGQQAAGWWGVNECAVGQTLYGVGLGIFGVSAYFYRVSVKYMVKIGTPVPNGYQV